MLFLPGEQDYRGEVTVVVLSHHGMGNAAEVCDRLPSLLNWCRLTVALVV
jgi:hypothetical protein